MLQVNPGRGLQSVACGAFSWSFSHLGFQTEAWDPSQVVFPRGNVCASRRVVAEAPAVVLPELCGQSYAPCIPPRLYAADALGWALKQLGLKSLGL